MAYQPQENELIISCKSINGGAIGSISATMLQMTDTPIIIAFHDSNLWIEVEGVFGFSIDREIAIYLLNKIKESKREPLEKVMD